MMKRLLRIGVFISFIFCGFRATAQETQVVEAYRYYPNYSFWSNWSIGLNGGMTLNLDRGVTYSTIEPSYGLNLFLSKELNYIWDLRLQGTFHKVNNGLGRGLSMGVGFTFSIFDAIKINPERLWKLYILATVGMGIDKNGYIVDNYGNICYMANAGIGFSYRIAEKWTASLESSVYLPGDLGKPWDGGFKGYYIYNSLSLAYNFGVTEYDKVRLEQESQLTQENFDALAQERDLAKAELESAKQKERTLQEKFVVLEKTEIATEKVAKNDAELAKLKAQIARMKEEQLTFYALPLSILYSIDQYKIPSGEMRKMKAIAKVMKDNPDYKFAIVGFADYSGSPEYNQKLSLKRAEEAKKVLVNKYGIDPDRLVVEGKGQTESFGDVKMSINRRVSFYRVIE
ncbi:MAG: OmpA family protein [Bacteroidales bacterium]|nr:OmpA family protein [Bacteroidales bacterium]